ncbi:hypothetical protein R1080702_122 [Cyanophage S-RIM32]|uniref:Uncharacterized protein n=1 Tax=Cyanophage S-RIM32 TaxID=1278479 RepID=A0A127KME1_9CAUD|nr:hypothetical protein BJD26_gp134 [Cyanophage S-RIM32]AMO43131.1 hypothetical protein R1080702_122 [Cyanophage S-RIM32]
MAKYDAEYWNKKSEKPVFAGNYDGPLYAPWKAVVEGKKNFKNKDTNRSQS